MTLNEKVEGYLVKLGLSFNEAAAGTWVVSHTEIGLENLIVQLAGPLVVLRIHVMEVPASGREKLFHELLRLNAADLVHGAYAVDGNSVIIIDTLEAETMDLEELQASIDAIGLALAQHYRSLSAYRTRHSRRNPWGFWIEYAPSSRPTSTRSSARPRIRRRCSTSWSWT